MDDSQSPPDAEPRDGSHKDEAAHRTSEEPGRPAIATEPTELAAAAPETTEASAAAETTDASDSAEPPEASPESAQSLDAFIDSLPAAPPPPDDAPARLPLTDAGLLLIPPVRYNKVSNIFDGLGSQRPHTEAASDEASSLVGTDLDGDAPPPGPNGAAASADPAAQPARPDAAVPGLSTPLLYEPAAPDAPMPEPSDWPPEATGAQADGDTPPPHGEAAEPATSPAADATLADGVAPAPPAADATPADGEAPAPPAVAETGAETAGDEEEGGSEHQSPADRSADNTDAEPFPEPLGWPPFMEPPGAEPGDSDVEPLKPPSLVTNPEPVTSASPFPGPPAWPPFMDPPGSGPELATSAPSGLPPYIELPAHPDQEEAATAEPAHFDEPPRPGVVRGEMPVYDELPPPAPAPREVPRFHAVEPTAPRAEAAPRTAAASAKIAAEANATAQALDNLQRLLSKTVPPASSPAMASALPPEPQMYRSQPPPQRPQNQHFQMPQDNPFAPDMPPPMLPLPMRHAIGEASDMRVYVLGFLTGLVLSVVAGLALYFLINFG